jgi:anti-anti-sigma factor
MKAQLQQKGNITIVELNGHTEYQNSKEFRDKLIKLYEDHGVDNVLLDMEDLDFVGSSGIRKLVDALKDVGNINQSKPVLCGVKTEFQRVFNVMAEDEFEIYEDKSEAIETLKNFKSNS